MAEIEPIKICKYCPELADMEFEIFWKGKDVILFICADCLKERLVDDD